VRQVQDGPGLPVELLLRRLLHPQHAGHRAPAFEPDLHDSRPGEGEGRRTARGQRRRSARGADVRGRDDAGAGCRAAHQVAGPAPGAEAAGRDGVADAVGDRARQRRPHRRDHRARLRTPVAAGTRVRLHRGPDAGLARLQRQVGGDRVVRRQVEGRVQQRAAAVDEDRVAARLRAVGSLGQRAPDHEGRHRQAQQRVAAHAQVDAGLQVAVVRIGRQRLRIEQRR
jgi:hypothetical protein